MAAYYVGDRFELVIDLGAIAMSGTTDFMEAFAAGGDISMIGRFDVGLFSAYLVSDKVHVVSKYGNGEQDIRVFGTGGSFTDFRKKDISAYVSHVGAKSFAKSFFGGLIVGTSFMPKLGLVFSALD